MLLASDEVRERRQQILKDRAAGLVNDEEAGQRLIEADPEFGPGWLALAMSQGRAGDRHGEESSLWRALETAPSDPHPYLVLSTLYKQRGDSVLSDALGSLAFSKVSFCDEVPESISASFRKVSGDAATDPALYEEMAETFKATLGDQPWPERLLPHRLLNDVQWHSQAGLDASLLSEIQANAAVCAPIFCAALRESYDSVSSTLTPEAECLVIALLGEVGGPELIGDLLTLPDLSQEAALHAEWAVMRLGQRFSAEARTRLRAIGQDAPHLRAVLAQHLYFLREAGVSRKDVAALLDGFSEFAADDEAPYLLLTVSTVLALMGSQADALATLKKYERQLSKQGRRWLLDATSDEEGFLPDLIGIAVDSVDVEVVCRDLGLMPAGEVRDDWGEDEGYEEDEAPVEKPGRNDPCWCGSDKKYKKCHLDQDEREAREGREEDDLFSAALGQLLDFSRQFHRKSDMERASKLFFGRRISEVDEETVAESGFVLWYLLDFRASAGARTVIEEFLRRGERLDDRMRELIESWRDHRYGLWEVQRIEEGRGAEVRDVISGETYFVGDVTTSRECNRWDCMISRLHHFEGKWLFLGDGLLVPRPLLARIRAEIEARASGAPAAGYFRSRSHEWRRFVLEAHDEQWKGLRLVNVEGDPIEFSSAEYEVGNTDAVASVLSGLPMFEQQANPDEALGGAVFGWVDDDRGHSYGRIEIGDGKLRLECHSRRRLEIGRGLIEQYCGVFARHLGDTFMEVEGVPPAEPVTPIDPALERELILKVEAEHYAKWPDTRLPALDGRTPRQAVRSKRGRQQVEELLRDFENASERARKEGRPAFDFSGLRSELGL